MSFCAKEFVLFLYKIINKTRYNSNSNYYYYYNNYQFYSSANDLTKSCNASNTTDILL